MQRNFEVKLQKGLTRLNELREAPNEVYGEEVALECSFDSDGKLHVVEIHSENPLIGLNPVGRQYLQIAAQNTFHKRNEWLKRGGKGTFRVNSTRNINAGIIVAQPGQDGELRFLQIIKSYQNGNGGKQFALDCIAGGPNLKTDLRATAVAEGYEEAVIWNMQLNKLLLFPGNIPQALADISKNVRIAQELGLQVPPEFQILIEQANINASMGDYNLVHQLSFAESILPLNTDVTIVGRDGTQNTFDADCFFHGQGADVMFYTLLPEGDLRIIDSERTHANGVELDVALARKHALLTRWNMGDLLTNRSTSATIISPTGSGPFTINPQSYPPKPLGRSVAMHLALM